MNDAWEYRKNRAKVGGYCAHGVWWSVDCGGCVAESVTKSLQNYGENRLDTPATGA
jgi:hypothetical protein